MAGVRTGLRIAARAPECPQRTKKRRRAAHQGERPAPSGTSVVSGQPQRTFHFDGGLMLFLSQYSAMKFRRMRSPCSPIPSVC
ncbi:hypothetical protein LX15_000249 [Streptoalloteichus tenebrarius]|uniref:Uncharacterized protein n=1 Tax=Streptoalloteichus tenebrarius (strain ATCC 17920 / DSM 40477 / JCM 4838 / CBS 697.72 / NBRC 16177 / NCIMB 11028 / NRRL B-12390 / A12253. 1 / ISP 5477) TaxID=1933 RepID=A0ABT1HM21_STRSD|nr:hypothetical protein [Streptoalloteichus tenebrarius]